MRACTSGNLAATCFAILCTARARVVEHLRDALALVRARGLERHQRFGEQLLRRRGERRRIALRFTDHAGPAQQVHRVDVAGGAETALHEQRVLDQAVEQLVVEFDFARAGDGRAQVERRIHLAAAHGRADRLAELGLRRRAVPRAGAARPRDSGD